jgi:hypothetical protein
VFTRAKLRPLPLTAAVVIMFALTACAGSRFGAGSPSPSAAEPGASVPASQAPPSEVPSASTAASVEPSEDLGPFACEFPLEERGEPVHTQIVDVRVGEHDGYDRVVFEFDNGIPEFIVSQAEPPYTQDPSGLPIEVEGVSVLQLVMIGATRFDAESDYEPTYAGPTEFDPGFERLVHLIESGDFEAVSSWYIGLSGDACVRVLTLDGPDRLVVDIEH